MDSLLGIVLVAQFPGKEAQVIFTYPPESEAESLELESQPRLAAKGNGSLAGSPLENSPVLGPSDSPSLEGSVAGENPSERKGSGAAEAFDTVKDGRRFDTVTMPSSLEDHTANLQQDIFGIPAKNFASLMLPAEKICNRPLYMDFDAGRQQKNAKDKHGKHSHLQLASFPCHVSNFDNDNKRVHTDFPEYQAKSRDRGPYDFPDYQVFHRDEQSDLQEQQDHTRSLENNDRVQRFNIVHVICSRTRHSRRNGSNESNAGTLWQVSSHLSRGLVVEEVRNGYLSREILQLSQGSSDEEKLRASRQAGRLGLAALLVDMHLKIRKYGYSSQFVNGVVLCQVSIFPKNEAPTPPSAEQALALLVPREELKQELPPDGAHHVGLIIDKCRPTLSLQDLAAQLSPLTFGVLQRTAQHLVYWKKAIVVDTFKDDTRVMLRPGLTHAEIRQAANEFFAWQDDPKQKKGAPANHAFSEVLDAFQGAELKTIRAELDLSQAPDYFDRILEWLIAHHLLVQMGTFYHFLPALADPSKPVLPHDEYKDKWKELFKQDERDLIRCRVKAEQERNFLFTFIKDFARKHQRADGANFAQLAKKCFNDKADFKARAQKVLDTCSDFMVKYHISCGGTS